jgi:hypothetical protein
MAVLWTFRAPSLYRHVRRELMRNVWLDFPPSIPATACHQRNCVETYSKSTGKRVLVHRPIRLDGMDDILVDKLSPTYFLTT